MKYLTSKEMALVDKLVVEKYNVAILQMMENAGSNFARFVSRLKPKHVIVFFGKGNNGGDGLAAARHLAIYGIKVTLIQASKELNENATHQLLTLNKMGITPSKSFKAKKGDVIIDSLLGYNIKGNPREPIAELIRAINFSKSKGVKVVSFDLPSGLNPNTGKAYDPCVNADYTLTLALPKTGLRKLNNLYLVNLGIPNELYKELGININKLFEKGDVVKIK